MDQKPNFRRINVAELLSDEEVKHLQEGKPVQMPVLPVGTLVDLPAGYYIMDRSRALGSSA